MKQFFLSKHVDNPKYVDITTMLKKIVGSKNILLALSNTDVIILLQEASSFAMLMYTSEGDQPHRR